MSMVETIIDSIRVSLISLQRLVVLRERDGERFLPIWVGQYEAEAITTGLQDIETIRPLTHDLLKNTITGLNGRIERVEINALRDNTYYGNIVVESNGHTINIDARPSDAIALAVRARAPIFVESEVLQQAGASPEDDLSRTTPAEPPAPPTPNAPQPAEPSTDRLSIFEDFLSKIDSDKKDDEDNQKKD